MNLIPLRQQVMSHFQAAFTAFAQALVLFYRVSGRHAVLLSNPPLNKREELVRQRASSFNSLRLSKVPEKTSQG